MNLLQLNVNARQIDSTIIVNNALTKNGIEILKSVKDQLKHGILNDNGKELRKTYANKDYLQYKLAKNPDAEGYVDLENTGDFKGAMYVEGDFKGVKITSADPKTNKLKKKYGNDVLGLTDSKRIRLIEEKIKPQLQKDIRQTIGI